MALLGLLSDLSEWLQAAALALSIGGACLLLFASLIVGYMPFADKLPVIAPYVTPARCVAFLAFGGLTALVTLQFAGDRCDALRSSDRAAAERARVQRDDAINRELQNAYGPVLQDLANRNAELQGRVNNAKRNLAARPSAASRSPGCRLGDAAGGVRAQSR